jgi:hypothetical protein
MLQINVLGQKAARKSRRVRKQRIVPVTGVLAVLGLTTALAILAPHSHHPARGSQAVAEPNPSIREEGARESASSRAAAALRPVYRHSVVPGGVEDADELRRAMERDPVVRRHYEQVRLSKIEETIVPQAKWAYVSYRIGEQVYWTRRPVLLHKGEKLLTDGRSVVRARCGNQVSFAPRLPVAKADPTDMDFGDLIPPPEQKRDRFVPIVPIFFPVGGEPPPRRHISADEGPDGVPWPVLATGVVAILLFRRRWDRVLKAQPWRGAASETAESLPGWSVHVLRPFPPIVPPDAAKPKGAVPTPPRRR